MPNVATTNQTLPAKIPSMPASVKALLADPFSLGGEVPPWSPPATLPDRRVLEGAVATLEAMLQPAASNHIGFLVKTMAKAMAMRQGQTGEHASRMDGWLLACGQLPADLWTEGCTELLRTKTFMPSPGELMAIVGGKLEERRRMLTRARSLLRDDPKDPKKPFVREPIDVRLRSMRDSLVRYGHTERAARYERELAALEKREPEEWARGAVTSNEGAKVNTPPAPPIERPAARSGGWRAGMPVYDAPMPRAAASDEPPAFDAIPEA